MIIQNIESELSYAYLHAVAAKAGMSCKQGDRHDDGAGVDAEINYRGMTSHPYLKHVQLNVQLKATVKDPGSHKDFLSYYMQGTKRYDKLRTNDSEIYKILVVLFLPNESSSWLSCSPDELILKKAAYWVCLYDAPASSNDTGQTVYLPKVNLLTPESLKDLIELAVNKKVTLYKTP
jgi:hypothetical protein